MLGLRPSHFKHFHCLVRVYGEGGSKTTGVLGGTERTACQHRQTYQPLSALRT